MVRQVVRKLTRPFTLLLHAGLHAIASMRIGPELRRRREAIGLDLDEQFRSAR